MKIGTGIFIRISDYFCSLFSVTLWLNFSFFSNLPEVGLIESYLAVFAIGERTVCFRVTYFEKSAQLRE